METITASPVATPEEPVSGPALLQPFRLRDFRLIFSGETISLIGDQFAVAGAIVVAAALAGFVAGVPATMTDEAPT